MYDIILLSIVDHDITFYFGRIESTHFINFVSRVITF